MTEPTAMPPARRRPIPGMTSNPTAPATLEPHAPDTPSPAAAEPAKISAPPSRARRRRPVAASPANGSATVRGQRRPASDYATTRLVNFRLPADLHDRYKQLVREAEELHPRLRDPSLTELLIALLEVYGEVFERTLHAHGTDADEVLERLVA